MHSIKFDEINWCAIFWFTIALRLLLSIMKTFETCPRYFIYSTPVKRGEDYLPIEKKARAFTNLPFYERLYLIFGGYSKREPNPDFLYNFFLGFIELAAYSFLMCNNGFALIGGWLVLKLAGQWNTWKANRYAIIRYYIATALQLIFCYAYLANYPPLK